MDVTKPPPELELTKLRATKVLGRGATGTVFLVHHDSHDHPFALKVVEKSSLHRHATRRALHEISLLRRLSAAPHPFLPHLIGSSENEDFICWATPFCPGGDLNVLRHRQNDQVFSPAVIRFYAAEIISALHHLHRQGIAYRDLKPENILVQHSGHVTLTDFDLSRDLNLNTMNSDDMINFQKPLQTRKFRFFNNKNSRVSPRNPNPNNLSRNHHQRSNSFVGTDEYLSPEVILGDGHDFAVDWWALGVLCYEMLYGTTPFKGRNRKETFQKILMAEPVFNGKPNELTDLIAKLLEKDPTRRLGFRRGAAEIKEHEFFRGLRWDLVKEVLRPPFVPLGEETEAAVQGGIDIWEYFEKLHAPPSPLWSPSPESGSSNGSLTEF